MAKSISQAPSLSGAADAPADAIGIQVPVGRIRADRVHWQVVFDARSKPSIYRLHNGSRRTDTRRGTTMIVEVDGAQRPLTVRAGASLDVLAKTIRVKAGSGSAAAVVEGWYVLVS